MKLIETNWHPTNRQLRQFGFICLIALPLVGWWWGASSKSVGWLAVVGLLLAILGVAVPAVIKPVFLALTIVATPIGLVLSELILLLIYFVVFLPIGLFFRLAGRDALQLRVDRDSSTYWQPKKQPKDTASYYRQS